MNLNAFLNSLVNYEKTPGYKYDLAAFKAFLEKLDSPHKRLKNVIIIAGTKGKGSTATIISSCLIASGYKVGLFTSPHLIRINERIKINNQEISNKEMEKYIRIIKPHINFKNRLGARTFFETIATIAFMYFVDRKVDFAVFEAGLGGRLDATNVFNSHIPVITRIGYDHMNLLGNRLSEIAYEKAGIIPFHRQQTGNGKVITIHQRRDVEKVLKKIARKRRNKIIFADDLHKIAIKNITLNGTELSIHGALGKFDASLPLVGRHQIENLKIALAVLFELKRRGFKINLRSVKKGIENARLPGRFDVLSKNPLVIYDVAHNEDSFKALNNNIEELILKENGKNIYIIFGCNKDKSINYAVKEIFPKAKKVLLVRADNPRAMEPAEICKKAKRYQRNIIIANTVRAAIKYIKRIRDQKKAVIIFGSFYLYSELKSKKILDFK